VPCTPGGQSGLAPSFEPLPEAEDFDKARIRLYVEVLFFLAASDNLELVKRLFEKVVDRYIYAAIDN